MSLLKLFIFLNMNNSKVKTVIVLGIVSIICILTIQFFWIKRNLEYQRTNIKIQNIQDSLSDRQFGENVSLALKNVATEIQIINKQESDLYGKVKQLSSNYFIVELEDTLHPFLLENLLKSEFYHQNIKDDFRYGIYDCYSDSIIYGDYIRYSGDSVFVIEKNINDKIDSKLQNKLETDVHYFAVSFPNKQSYSLSNTARSVAPWYYMIAILLFILTFFGFTISIILRQKKLSEIKNDFINNMTHELKTPISTIRLSSESLLYSVDNSPEKIEKFSSIIYKENKRLEQQVERVLNIAKLDKGEIKLKHTTFNIHEIIEEAKENFEFNQLEGGGKIELKLGAQQKIIYSDMVHLTNVIYNLLDNATKYCDKTPEILIETEDIKDKIRIKIHDNGKGILKENLKFIFDKFYRVPTGNVHDVKGFGLGLFYVKSIVEELKGKVSVKSHLGVGSEFILDIPINKDMHEGKN